MVQQRKGRKIVLLSRRGMRESKPLLQCVQRRLQRVAAANSRWPFQSRMHTQVRIVPTQRQLLRLCPCRPQSLKCERDPPQKKSLRKRQYLHPRSRHCPRLDLVRRPASCPFSRKLDLPRKLQKGFRSRPNHLLRLNSPVRRLLPRKLARSAAGRVSSKKSSEQTPPRSVSKVSSQQQQMSTTKSAPPPASTQSKAKSVLPGISSALATIAPAPKATTLSRGSLSPSHPSNRKEALSQRIRAASVVRRSASPAKKKPISTPLDRLQRPTEAWKVSHSPTPPDPAKNLSVPEKANVKDKVVRGRPAENGKAAARVATPPRAPKPATASQQQEMRSPSQTIGSPLRAGSPIRSPLRFTPEMAEHLTRPTESRISAIKAASPLRHGQSAAAAEEEHHHIPAELPATSHLLTPTAVSKARKTSARKPIERPPSPKRVVTSVSPHLLQITAAREASDYDGQAKARERIRQHRLERQQQLQQQSQTEAVKPAGKKIFTAQDGIAKARERLRQRKALQKRNGSRNEAVRRQHPESRGASAAARPSSTAAAKRPPTLPQTPRFATNARHGKRPPSGRPVDLPLAQRADAFGKGLREDMSTGSAGSRSKSSQRSLTIPAEPNFATSSRLGSKQKPPKVEMSLAQSHDVLQKELRGSYKPPAATKRKTGPTIPVAPKFHKIAPRSRPKSSEEQEEELMQYNKTHPFKAKSALGSQSSRHLGFMEPTQGSIARTHTTPHEEDPGSQVGLAHPVPSDSHAAPAVKPSFTSRPRRHSVTMTEAARRRAEEIAAREGSSGPGGTAREDLAA